MKTVVIIGAGVQGLAAARTFVDLGYQVRIFEKLDGVGGTWHKKKSYPGLASHGPMKNLFYPDFPGPKGFDEKKPFVREDYVDYLNSYARHFGIFELISFNSNVTEIRYGRDQPDKAITVKVQNVSTTEVTEQKCDFVIYTTFTTVGFVPKFRGDETFDGKIIHSSDLNDEILNDSLREGKRIIVLGGNKSAADVVAYLESRSYENYLWVFRQNTWGANYKHIADGSRTIRIGLYIYFKIFQSRRFGWLGGLAFLPLRLFGFFVSPFPESHPLRIGFNGAIWRQAQMDVLRQSKFHRGEIANIAGRQVFLTTRGQSADSGTIRDAADLIVCGTSFVQTKDANVIIAENGKERLLEQGKEDFLFRNMIHPSAPRIVFWNGGISPGRITLSAYLLALWFHTFFCSWTDEKFSFKSMMQDIENDKEMMRKNGFSDFSVWRTFQKAQGLFVEKNSQVTLKDLGLLNLDLRMILLSASPIELKNIYLKKLDELKSLPG
jgi:cation diffusion facilitator CzcD-associated flavoprotein CzcO